MTMRQRAHQRRRGRAVLSRAIAAGEQQGRCVHPPEISLAQAESSDSLSSRSSTGAWAQRSPRPGMPGALSAGPCRRRRRAPWWRRRSARRRGRRRPAPPACGAAIRAGNSVACRVTTGGSRISRQIAARRGRRPARADGAVGMGEERGGADGAKAGRDVLRLAAAGMAVAAGAVAAPVVGDGECILQQRAQRVELGRTAAGAVHQQQRRAAAGDVAGDRGAVA